MNDIILYRSLYVVSICFTRFMVSYSASWNDFSNYQKKYWPYRAFAQGGDIWQLYSASVSSSLAGFTVRHEAHLYNASATLGVFHARLTRVKNAWCCHTRRFRARQMRVKDAWVHRNVKKREIGIDSTFVILLAQWNDVKNEHGFRIIITHHCIRWFLSYGYLSWNWKKETSTHRDKLGWNHAFGTVPCTVSIPRSFVEFRSDDQTAFANYIHAKELDSVSRADYLRNEGLARQC